LDCAFTWRQSENYITVSRKVLEQLAGLKKPADPDAKPDDATK
jgi:hypothetical protein